MKQRFLLQGIISDIESHHLTKAMKPKYKRDIAIELLWQIQKQANRNDWGAGVFGGPLCAAILEGIHKGYKRYLDLFRAIGVIHCDDSYMVGRNAKTYTFDERYRDRDVEFWQISGSIVLKAIQKHENSRIPTHTGALRRQALLAHVTIDLPAAEVFIDAQDWKPQKKAGVRLLCQEIASGNYMLTKDAYQREHTSITSLPAVIRQQFLRIDGEPVVECDISTSQPRFLLRWLHDKNIPATELQAYQTALTNDFYTSWATEWQRAYGTSQTREEAKQVVFRVFFDRSRQKDRYHQLFRRLYPSIYRILNDYKKKYGHSKVAQELQALEAEFMLGLSDLIMHPHYTIHDSIGVAASKAFIGKVIQHTANYYTDGAQ